MASRAIGLDLRQRSAEILALGEELPRLWRAATTRSGDRKQIVRLVIKDVALDQKRRRGYVWIKVNWQTGAASEHWLQRCVQGYEQHADQDRLRQCIAELNRQQKMDGEIAAILNKEALRTAHGAPFPAAWFTFCGRGGGSKTSRSTAQPRTRRSGPTEAIRSRAPLRLSSSHLKSYSIGSEKGGWQARNSPRACLGRSHYPQTKPPRSVPESDAPTGPRERHHESVESPNTVAHSPKLRLVVMMTLARS